MPDEERQTLILVEERKTLNSTRPPACFSSLSGPCSTRCRPRLWYVEDLYYRNYCSLCSPLHLVTGGISYVCLLLLYSCIDELGASALLNVTLHSLVNLEAAIQTLCRVLSFLFFALSDS